MKWLTKKSVCKAPLGLFGVILNSFNALCMQEYKKILLAREEGSMADNLKVGSPPGSAPERPKLLDPVRDAVRPKPYSYRTETYVHWIKRFV